MSVNRKLKKLAPGSKIVCTKSMSWFYKEGKEYEVVKADGTTLGSYGFKDQLGVISEDGYFDPFEMLMSVFEKKEDYEVKQCQGKRAKLTEVSS